MQRGSLIRRKGAYSAAVSVLSGLQAEHDGDSIATRFAHADDLLSSLATFAAESWPCASAVRLSPRRSQGLFRMRADALGWQGGIIIVCLWQGALCPIIQGSPYVVSLFARTT